ncbi:LOW QUALITY PROTEIN: hypothetical protein PHMEG_00034287 [Phytophthora megakarya]|uniref:Cleavage induced protein n=1 Tax=Phytophthora megakarya TaxID=4795 RepID=A0A225URV2_9STRA|nr:LOW QUALITY PROTEIN: hypothetical protein PHMEG_00034287 [Phytophthora megakarya]
MDTRNFQEDILDHARIKTDSAVARRSDMKLPEFVRAFRGQTAQDGRPNKALYELPLPSDPQSRELTQAWNRVVKVFNRNGHPQNQIINVFVPETTVTLITTCLRSGVISAKGHREGHYLLSRLSCCLSGQRFWLVPLVWWKNRVLTGQIFDYAYSERASVNAYTDISVLHPISYNPPADIARRLYQLRQAFPVAVILMMVGDVAGAFRHIPIHENHVHMFAFMFENYLVIDLSCGFGWCGSPAYYALAGKIIHSLYGSSSPDPRFSGLDRSCFGQKYVV